MAVRFLPSPDDASVAQSRDRSDLAEVIEFRTRLSEPSPPQVKPGTEPQIGERAARQELPKRPERPEDPQRPEGLKNLPGRERLKGSERNDSSDQIGSKGPRAWGESNDINEIARIGRVADTESLEDESPEQVAKADAVRLLARRARSSGEVRRELERLGHAAHDVEAVILHCETSLYLDDLGLARVLTETLRERKHASRTQIRTKLRERLLPDGVIEVVLGELDEDEEHELLRQAAADRARKMTGLDRQTAERRLLGFLARRGWSGERASRVAREALDATAARGTVRFR